MSCPARNIVSSFDMRRLILYYRPFVNSQSGGIVGLESILFLDDNSPASPELIRLRAQGESDLLLSIGNWNIRAVCDQLAGFRDDGVFVLPVTVRVVREQLFDSSFFTVIQNSLRRVKVPEKFVEFSFPEAFLFSYSQQIQHTMSQLNELGAPITVNDFGTDCIIFKQIKNLPVHSVRLHKSLISQIGRSKHAEKYLQMICTKLKDYGIACCGTNVTNESQELFLSSIGCNIIQYSDPPLTLDTTTELLSSCIHN